MIKTIAILLTMSVIIAIWLRIKRRKSANHEARIVVGDAELVPESVSKERAQRVMPKKPSEDARGLLVVPALTDPTDRSDNYPPEAAVTWVVDVVFPKGTELSGKQVQALIDHQFLKSIDGPMTHGLCRKTGKWT